MKCSICKQDMDVPGRPDTGDCGGDCLACMAEANDPTAIRTLRKLAEQRGSALSMLKRVRHLLTKDYGTKHPWIPGVEAAPLLVDLDELLKELS